MVLIRACSGGVWSYVDGLEGFNDAVQSHTSSGRNFSDLRLNGTHFRWAEQGKLIKLSLRLTALPHRRRCYKAIFVEDLFGILAWQGLFRT